jgi:DNA primase
MRIPEATVAEIARVADIVQVVSSYVHLKRAGKDFRGHCPFHGDKDPSFYVSPAKSIFYCFGCAAGGSVFNFIMRIENASFTEAVKILADRFGIPVTLDNRSGASPQERDRVRAALETAQRYFAAHIGRASAATDYLRGRDIDHDWTESLGLGFAPESWDGMCSHLRSAGVAIGDAIAGGLIRPRAGGGHYDYFRSRIMIPIRDLSGNLIAYGGRIVGEGEPKYLNSPESLLFHKKSVLFGLDTAKDAIRSEGFVIVVEGYFDQLSLRIHGFANTVAPLGTALGSDHVRLIKRFSERAIIIFDSDEAGLKALKRSLPVFLEQGIEPDCVVLRDHKDPDEAVRSLGGDEFRRLIDARRSMVDFLVDWLRSQFDVSTLLGRRQALEECVPVLRNIADSSERDYLLERLSSALNVREERFRELLRGMHRDQGAQRQGSEPKPRTLFDFPADERNVVRGMLLRDGFLDQVAESGILKDLEDPTLSLLAREMLAFRDRRGYFEPSEFCRSLADAELASLVAGWMKPRPEEDDLRPEVYGDRVIDQSVESIGLKKLEKRKVQIKELMNQCDPGDDEYNALAKELWALGRRLRP